MRNRMLLVVLLLVGVVALTGQTVMAGTVNFGTLGTFEGASDLDLSGTFLYTVHVTPDSTESHTVSGLTFTADGVLSGVSVASNGAADDFQTKPDYGTSSDDNALEEVMWDIRFGNKGSSVAINAAVTLGQEYKLQLLFSSNWSGANSVGGRIFDIKIENALAVDNFDIIATTGTWTAAPTVGAVYTYTFTAGDTNLDIDLTAGTGGGVNDPLINGMTLEAIPIPEPSSLVLAFTALLGLFVWRKRA